MRDLSGAHWRDSARNVKFFGLDGRAVFPLILVVIWPRMWSLVIALIAVFFFAVLSRFGFTPVVFFRLIRTFVAGSHIQSQPWWMK